MAQDGTQHRSKVVFKMLVMAELKLFKFLTFYGTFVSWEGPKTSQKGIQNSFFF